MVKCLCPFYIIKDYCLLSIYTFECEASPFLHNIAVLGNFRVKMKESEKRAVPKTQTGV